MDDDVEGEGQMNGMYRMYVQCRKDWQMAPRRRKC